MLNLDCRSCGPITPRVSWRRFANDTLHLDARCPGCQRHLRFVPQVQAWLAVVEPVPREQPSHTQLALFG